MDLESGSAFLTQSSRIIVVANEKGGSGKSTIAINIAVALLRAGHSVATLDLDTRQRSLTHYIDNRIAWSRESGREIVTPAHISFADEIENLDPADQGALHELCLKTIQQLAAAHGFVIIDTPGHDAPHIRAAHLLADTLVTPINDSFVDLDVLGTVEPKSFSVVGVGHYAQVVADARKARQDLNRKLDWIVLRNRLSHINTRNKRLVGDALADLSRQLDFTIVEGLAERLIFREFYPRGLTAVDDLTEATMGTRPTLSHASAALEMQNLIRPILGIVAPQDELATAAA